jgi:hypothetical protein
VGFVPFTQNCVQGKKVRHELGQREIDVMLEEVKTSNKDLVDCADRHGLNAGIFDARISVAKYVQRETDEDDHVKKLVATKGSFSASALWNKNWQCKCDIEDPKRAACFGCERSGITIKVLTGEAC